MELENLNSKEENIDTGNNVSKYNGQLHGDSDDASPLLLYDILATPPWYSTVLFALQQACMCILGSMTLPLIIGSIILCGEENSALKAEMFCTSILVTGIATLMQCSTGIRLPIVQGAHAAFPIAVLGIMSIEHLQCENSIPRVQNDTQFTHNTSNITTHNASNTTENGITEAWRPRLLEVQGSLMLASLVQVVLGLTGAIGFLMRFIGPLTIVPVMVMVSMSCFQISSKLAEDSWPIWGLTCALLFIFGVYLEKVTVPLPSYDKRRGWHSSPVYLFAMFPILFALIISWVVCAILTATDVFPSNPESIGYKTPTDAKTGVIGEADWIFVSYPGQYGMPTVTASGFLGMLTLTIASVLESVGDYNIAARICEMPGLPAHAVNRGILVEGFSGVLAGALGTGHSTTSYSNNLGLIRITKVASLRVFQCAGVIIIVFGLIGKFGAVMVTIPVPIQGGIFTFSICLVGAVGLSSLKNVDMKSSRNLAILGFSLLIGLMVPEWVKTHPEKIDTGKTELDNILYVSLTTHIFLAGVVGFFLDNTVPGTLKQRGITVARRTGICYVPQTSKDKQLEGIGHDTIDDIATTKMKLYNWPFQYLRRVKVFRYIPVCPSDSSTDE